MGTLGAEVRALGAVARARGVGLTASGVELVVVKWAHIRNTLMCLPPCHIPAEHHCIRTAPKRRSPGSRSISHTREDCCSGLHLPCTTGVVTSRAGQLGLRAFCTRLVGVRALRVVGRAWGMATWVVLVACKVARAAGLDMAEARVPVAEVMALGAGARVPAAEA